MAAKEFDIPKLPTYIEIPEINEGVMRAMARSSQLKNFKRHSVFQAKK